MIAGAFKAHHDEMFLLLALAVASVIVGGLLMLWWLADRRLTDLERSVDRLLSNQRAAEAEKEDHE